MKIKDARVWIECMQLKTPYAITNHQFDHVELVMLELELENGIVGIGSSSPAEEVVHETASHVLESLRKYLPEQVVGKEIESFEKIILQSLSETPFSPGMSAALDIALHDCFGKYTGKSVVDLYGRKVGPLPTSVTIGICDITDTLKMAKEYVSKGFSIFKLKTGMDIDEDIEKLIKLRENFGTAVKIRLDANQGYNLESLKYFLKKTDHLAIELIEQPIPKGKESELMLIDEIHRSNFVADESLIDLPSAILYANDIKPFGIFNIKLMKCGGILASRKIAEVAGHSAISLFWGCNDESICSISAALHAAYSQPHTRYLDLDGSFDLEKDLVRGGFHLYNGKLYINELPGLGIVWDFE